MNTILKLTLVASIGLLSLLACDSSTSSGRVSAIALSPSPCAVSRTNPVQMSAQATFPDGTKKDVTSAFGATWSTANANTATANPTGVVVGVNAGVTAVTVAYQGATGTIDCAVGP